jgi:hypothetical protein
VNAEPLEIMSPTSGNTVSRREPYGVDLASAKTKIRQFEGELVFFVFFYQKVDVSVLYCSLATAK